MINSRLVNTVSESKKYVKLNIAYQWFSLCLNIIMIYLITNMIGNLLDKNVSTIDVVTVVGISLVIVIVRFFITKQVVKMSYLSSVQVKKKLRPLIYNKLLKVGRNYHQLVNTSEVIQVSVEGVEQLETYFGAYLPQFFYSLLAPFTLFIVMCFIDFKVAIVLLVCVPLIPITIALIQTIAKRLLSKYWDKYASLGDSFLENIQGLTTLKIFQSDKYKNEMMNKNAQDFRRITMRVLVMQLNSITIMDLIAYGGAALGMIIAVTQFQNDLITLSQTLFIILIAADFFIPMRQLGSYFHIAMNGMAASKKIFKLLDIDVDDSMKKELLLHDNSILLSDLSFSYDNERTVLDSINIKIEGVGLYGIVGESGSGKSTLSALLSGAYGYYQGSLMFYGNDIRNYSDEQLMSIITSVSHNSYLFKGTIRDNLLMGKSEATDDELWSALKQTGLADFIENEKGLDTLIQSNGNNLSGGQRQRLSFARALLHDSDVYVFDEATSNIDIESEKLLNSLIERLSKSKTVIVIAHRLMNVVSANEIFVLKDGNLLEHGTHHKLLDKKGAYYHLWNTQKEFESIEGSDINA